MNSAIAIDSKIANYWSAKGWILYELKRYDEAFTTLEEATLLNPSEGFTKRYMELVKNQLSKKN